MTFKFLGLAVVAALSTQVSSESYLGLSFGEATTDVGSVEFDNDFGAIRFGHGIADQITLEGRIGRGMSNDNTGNARFKADYIVGIYGKYDFTTSDVKPYAVAGFTRAKADAFGSVSLVREGLSYGLGLDYNLSDEVSLNVEYIQLLDKSDYEVGAFSVGIATRF